MLGFIQYRLRQEAPGCILVVTPQPSAWIHRRRRHLAFGVSEFSQGADGNSDGDELDLILVVANARNGNFANLRLPVTSFAVSDPEAAYHWSLSTLVFLVRDGVDTLYRVP